MQNREMLYYQYPDTPAGICLQSDFITAAA